MDEISRNENSIKASAEDALSRGRNAAVSPVNTLTGVLEGMGGWKKRFFALLLAVAAGALASALIASYGLRFSYAVSWGGELIGVVSDKAGAQRGIESVSQTVSETLGREYDVAAHVDGRIVITGRETALDEKALERAMLDAVPETARFYVISAGGKVIGGMESTVQARRIIEEVLAGYRFNNIFRTGFVQDISIVYSLAPVSQLTGGEAFRQKLEEMIDNGELLIEYTCTTKITESIPYETETVDDDTLYYDRSKVLTAGVEGKVVRTVELTLVRGEETARRVISNEIIQDPVNEVLAVGSMDKPSYASKGSFIWPTSGVITSYFGPRSVSVGSSFHKGLDIADAYGTPIYAADGGEVIYSDWLGGYGYLIQIRHDNGDVSYYGHNSRLVAQVGDLVAQGDLISYMGNSGVSSGAHLHFEVRLGGEVQTDPLPMLPER